MIGPANIGLHTRTSMARNSARRGPTHRGTPAGGAALGPCSGVLAPDEQLDTARDGRLRYRYDPIIPAEPST